MKIQSSSDRPFYHFPSMDTLCCRSSAFCRHLTAKCDVLLAGQLLSFIVACSGAAQASLLLDCRLKAPMFTVGLFYMGLSLLLLKVIRNDNESNSQEDDDLMDKQDDEMTAQSSMTEPIVEDTAHRIGFADQEFTMSPSSATSTSSFDFWKKSKTYFPISLLDIYANYIVMRGFQYTTLTSVSLLDALAIPSALIISKLFLQRRYTKLHFLGVALCLGGILVNIATDYEVDKHEPESIVVLQFPHMMLGDFFAALGGLLVGASNVVQEVSVRTIGGPDEYLGMLGFWASVIAFVHCSLFERQEIAAFFLASDDQSGTCTGSTAWWILAAYVVTSLVRYIGTAQFLQVSEATFFNLSLLTGDIWSVVFSVAAQGILPQKLFFVALTGTIGGVIVYEMAPSPVVENGDHGDRMGHSHIELSSIEPFRDVSPDDSSQNDDEDEDDDLDVKEMIDC
jgi:solute carrier family 35 protein F1/2